MLDKYNQRRSIMQRALLLSIPALALTAWAGAAVAQGPTGPKNYAFSGQRSCLITQNGFTVASDEPGTAGSTAPGDEVPGGFEAFSWESLKGTITFNSDGTGTRIGTSTYIDNVQVSPLGVHRELNLYTFTEPFIWNQDASGEITINFNGITQITITQGVRAGNTATVTTVPDGVVGHPASKNPPTLLQGLESHQGLEFASSTLSERKTVLTGLFTDYQVCTESDSLQFTTLAPHN
jgi:hypothetical protein